MCWLVEGKGYSCCDVGSGKGQFSVFTWERLLVTRSTQPLGSWVVLCRSLMHVYQVSGQ